MLPDRDLFGRAISPAQRDYLQAGDFDHRLLKTSLQNLSPHAQEIPSDYFDIVVHPGETLDLAFTFAQIPRGSFSWTLAYQRHSPNSVLHLNTANNDHYQHGIPGVADSIEDLADWLRTVASALRKPTLRTIGFSMAAYAALLFGDLVDADFIFAYSPNISGEVNFLGRKLPYRSIAGVLPRVHRRAIVTFGAFELNDYVPIAACLDAGLQPNDITLLGNGHGGQTSLCLDRMLEAPGGVPTPDLVRNRHITPLDHAAIHDLATARRLVDERQHDDIVRILRSAAAIDVLNPEFQYRLAVHQLLAGHPEAALAAAREAVRLRAHHNAEAGFDLLGDDTDFRRKAIHDYGGNLGFTELKAISGLFDRAFANVAAPS